MNELPNMKARLDTLSTLWKKCDGYMVIIENGTNAGFQLVEEARELLIQQAKGDGSYLFAPVSQRGVFCIIHRLLIIDFIE